MREITRRSLLAAGAPLLAQGRPKNILLMIADDLGLHTGAYGDKTAVTPSLDRLAAEGTRFTNAFCSTASCSASRSVILSGLHNHSNGHYGHAHGEHNLSYLAKIRPVPDLLKDAGYRTGVLGKLHVNPLGRFRWDTDGQKVNPRHGLKMAEAARDFIQGAGSQPWYLHMGYTDPHREGATGFANRDYAGMKRVRFDPAKVRVPSYLPDNAETRGEVAEYYEAANRLDQGVGMMLDLLKETGQADNTLVVFISDNGMPFANAKTNCYDAGLHLPCLMRAPGRKAGVVNQAMVSWVDLMPTFVDWAGAKMPGYPVHGKSLLPMLEQADDAARGRAFFSHTFHEITMDYPMRGVRTRRYKYIRNLFPELEFPHASDLWGSKTWQSVVRAGDRAMVGARPVGQYLHRAAEELYDITADPDEVKNLAASAAHRATLLELRGAVQTWRKETNDPWLINDNYKQPFSA